MSHYLLNMPNNLQAQVKCGKVYKKRLHLMRRWPFLQFAGEARTGYVIKLTNGTEYHLVRTTAGNWPVAAAYLDTVNIKAQGTWQPIPENATLAAIKKAIDVYENKQ